MTYQVRTRAALSMTLCGALLAGCTSGPLFGSAARWRAGSVTAVVHRDAIPDGTSLQCLPTPSDIARRDDELIAVVRIQVGRGPFDLAVVLPQGSTVQAGDHMTIHPDLCTVRPASKQAS